MFTGYVLKRFTTREFSKLELIRLSSSTRKKNREGNCICGTIRDSLGTVFAWLVKIISKKINGLHQLGCLNAEFFSVLIERLVCVLKQLSIVGKGRNRELIVGKALTRPVN